VILIDTGAFYTLADDSDRNAAPARAFFRRQWETGRFATTSAVVLETWTLLRHRLNWGAARRFLEGLRGAGIAVLCVEPVDFELAARIVDDYADQELSLVDATTLSIMQRRGIREVFSIDKDFLLYRYGPGKRRSFTRWPG